MSTLSHWMSFAPELLFALGLVALPGLVLARALRFGWSDAAGLSPALGLGVLAIADEMAGRVHLHWGLPVIALTTGVGAVGCWLVSTAARRWMPARWNTAPQADTTPVWSVLQRRIALVTTVLAMAIGGYAIARGIGGPHGLIQVWDGDFHLNSIAAMAREHSAASSVVSHMYKPGAAESFYPPLFSGCAALLVTYFHVGPVVAANVMAVTIAMLWPLAMSIFVRHAVRATSFGYGVAMVGTATIALFPAMLLSWGVLWPNALSFVALPGVIVALLHVPRLDWTNGACDARTARLPGPVSCCLAVLLGLVGMVLAHPGAVFIIFYVGLVLAVWLGWRHLVEPVESPRARSLRTAGILVASAGFLALVLAAADNIASMRALMRYNWPTREGWDQAVGEVLTLATHTPAPGNVAMGVLMVLGVVVAVRTRQARWVVACLSIFAVYSILSAAVETSATRQLTGFWYSDSRRLYAILPLFALPLIALGADRLRALIAAHLSHLSEAMDGSIRQRLQSSAHVLGAVGVALVIVVLQGGTGTGRVSQTLKTFGYDQNRGFQITPREAHLYTSLRKRLPAGSTLAGNPFEGAGMAAVLSGHPAIFPVLTSTGVTAPSADRRLLQFSFDQFTYNEQVCAAVKRLKVAAVITSTGGYSDFPDADRYPGFNDLGGTPGLTVMAQVGKVTIYRVGDCQG